jgi:hypothetical protein
MDMKKIGWLFPGLITGILLTFGFLWVGALQNPPAAASSTNRPVAVTAPARLFHEAALAATPSFAAGSDELPPANLGAGNLAPSALATPVPGETLVYFVPSDNDATATVMYLYNTDSVAHTVALRGYNYNGVLVYSLNINIAASSFLRLASDSIAAAPPPSWATPAPIITNFTDFTYLGSLSLPRGVKVEGYVLFNPGTGTVDPRLDQGAIPLRFSTDPATLFLPAVQKGP